MDKDLGMPPAQFPAVSVMGSVQVALGFIQFYHKTRWGWRWHSLSDCAEAPDGPSQWSVPPTLLPLLHWTVENWTCTILNSSQMPLVFDLQKLNIVVLFHHWQLRYHGVTGSPRAGRREQHGLPHGVGRAGPHKADPAPQPQARASEMSVGPGMEMGMGKDKARPGQAIPLWLRDRACPSSSLSQAMQGCSAAQPQLGRGWGAELWGTATPWARSQPKTSSAHGASIRFSPGSPKGREYQGKGPLLASLVLNWYQPQHIDWALSKNKLIILLRSIFEIKST